MTLTLLRAAQVVTLNTEHDIFRPGGVLLDGERIVDVGPAETLLTPGVAVVDLGDKLLMPGLVNAHTHTPMTLFRGLAEGHSLLSLKGWYNAIRVWEQVMTADMVGPAVAVSCAEMIRTGTTCFADQYFFMDQVTPVVERSGLRAALAYGIVELGEDAAAAKALQEAEDFLGSLHNNSRLSGWIGPHAFFVDNRPETMRAELALADRFHTGLHFHLGTSGEEDRYCRQHYGHSAVTEMKRLGVLDRRVLAAHCLTTPPEDFPTLAQAPFTAVMAPSACMRAGVKASPLKTLRAEGVNTALGTDNVANNNSYDLFKEMHILGKLMSFREGEPNAIPARDIVDMATLGGARALGLEAEIGSLTPGKRADLISLDLNEIGWAPMTGQDVYTALVYAISGLYVRDVMVDGRWLLRDGKLTTLDYAAARAQLEAAHLELRDRRTHAI